MDIKENENNSEQDFNPQNQDTQDFNSQNQESFSNQENQEKPNKKSNTLKIIGLVVLIIIIIGAIFFVLNQNNPNSQDENIPDNQNNLEDVNSDINTNTNNQDQTEIEDENISENDTNTQNYADINSNNEIIIKDQDSYSLTKITAVDETKKEFDVNLYNINDINTQQELQNKMMGSTMSAALIAPLYGMGYNKTLSDITYNVFKNNNQSIKQAYSMYSDIIDIESVNENLTKQEFFKLNNTLLFGMLDKYNQDENQTNLDSNITQLKEIMQKVYDSDSSFRNVIMSSNFRYDGNIYQSYEYNYKEDQKKLYNNICDLNGNCQNLYNPEKEWITTDEWASIYAQN